MIRMNLNKLTASACGLVITTAFSAPSTSPTQDLSSIKKEITVVQKQISTDEKNLNDLNTQLKTAEKNISSLTLKITQLSTQIKSQESQLIYAKARKYQYDIKIKKQQDALEELLAASYRLQHQGRLGIYFSSESAEKTERFLKYYQALDIAIIRQIHEVRETIRELNKLMMTISSKTTQHQHSISDYQTKIHDIKNAQKNREFAITNINKTLNTHRKALDQLIENQKQLTSIVANLAKTEQMKNLSFAKQKGQLCWPTKGKIRYLFQEPMANDSVRWQGDLIEAETGTPVQAIYSGKVIYADWLRGYGLVVIVDHGDHYLSLYARNDTLNRKAGDYVNTGDVIGTVGASGGFQDPALYFELRHNTQAINPRDWFIKP